MKSTIRVDFQGVDAPGPASFEPAIRVFLDENEDYPNSDVRDKLLKTFFQSLGGTSSWLRVKFYEKQIIITPVKWNELESELEVFKDAIKNKDK